MDHHGDGHTKSCHPLELLDKQQGSGCIQAGGGLVQEQNRRASSQLDAHVDTLLLATTQALSGSSAVADQQVLLWLELQHLQNIIRDRLEPRTGGVRRHALRCGEEDVLTDSQPFMDHVVLWDEADDRLDRLNVDLLAVYQDVAFDGPFGVCLLLPRQNIKKGALAAARGTHDGREVVSLEGACDLVKDWSLLAAGQNTARDAFELQRCGLQLLGDAAEFVLLQFLDAEILQDRFQALVGGLDSFEILLGHSVPVTDKPLI
mmetsp:Transcript_64037/g.150089  ORF Transcript_64037/g.150089 Transcript_64037/m.150089 type:complete len:261 (-) Transcript_64037:119-901(-)